MVYVNINPVTGNQVGIGAAPGTPPVAVAPGGAPAVNRGSIEKDLLEVSNAAFV